MRRFFFINLSAAAIFLMFWVAWVVFTLKVADIGILRMVYWASLLLCLLTFPILGLASFSDRSNKQQALAFLVGLLLAPLVLYCGIVLMIEVKVGLGGGK